MKPMITCMLALAGLGLLIGCGGKQRDQMLANQAQLEQDLKQMREELSRQNQQALGKLDQAAQRDQEMMKIAQQGVQTQQQILTIARDTNQATKTVGMTLDKAYKEIYGVGLDLRSAIGETRVVIEVNNRLPLRVHSEIPRSSGMSEVIDKLPIGSVIFQAQKINDNWWKGVVLKEGEKVPVYFAGQYTRPLREEFWDDAAGGPLVERAGE